MMMEWYDQLQRDVRLARRRGNRTFPPDERPESTRPSRLRASDAHAVRSDRMSESDRPIGVSLPDWQPREWPPRTLMEGRYCRLEPLDAKAHADQLFAANRRDAEGANWTYLPDGPYEEAAPYRKWVEAMARKDDAQFYAVVVEVAPWA